ncbi:hypothetical protein [Streptomyces sp. AcE210]|uniref:hypothetical protein n=1 Tax=Streptomyces sp. AcE210 TaxID=2292703 RepID=UPI001404CF0F|nr:hypothetical protein [Streptomyces sp. AcE210]
MGIFLGLHANLLLPADFGVLPDGMRDVQQRVRDGHHALADRVGAATVTTGGSAR